MAKEKDNEIRIRGVNPDIKKTLYNIAKNLGFSTFTDYIKPKLREIIKESDDDLKRDYKI
jgi:hypothetical protein